MSTWFTFLQSYLSYLSKDSKIRNKMIIILDYYRYIKVKNLSVKESIDRVIFEFLRIHEENWLWYLRWLTIPVVKEQERKETRNARKRERVTDGEGSATVEWRQFDARFFFVTILLPLSIRFSGKIIPQSRDSN